MKPPRTWQQVVVATLVLVLSACTSDRSTHHAGTDASSTTTTSTDTPAALEPDANSDTAAPPRMEDEACRDRSPDGYSFVWSEATTVGALREQVRTLVTLAPEGVATTLALADDEAAEPAFICWAAHQADADTTIQYYVGPTGTSGTMCTITGSRAVVVNSAMNTHCL